MEGRKECNRRDLAELLDLIFGEFGGRLKHFKQRDLQLYGHWVSEGKENFTLDQFTGSCVDLCRILLHFTVVPPLMSVTFEW